MRFEMGSAALVVLVMVTGPVHADFKMDPALQPAPAVKVAPPAPVVTKLVAPPAPAVAEVKPPVRPPIVERKQPVWVVRPGSSLRSVLDEFSNKAGWLVEVSYKDEQTLEDKDLVLGGGMTIEGDFKKAVTEIFNSLPASAKIDAELWPENSPPTLFVFRKGTRK